MKILTVEDDVLSALILRRTLEQMGHEVISTGDGWEAWQLVQQNEFRLIISDWMMPRMDGLELCRRIRRLPDGPYPYVILLTAKHQRQDRIEGLHAGADDFLVKPLDQGELKARVHVARRILMMQEELRNRSRELEQMHAELGRQNSRLAEMAASDSLTGLKNRRYFCERLDHSYSFARRQGLPLSMVMMDVDRFKLYNDSFGHPAGDALLIDLANMLFGITRESDLVARYGGEEFVFLLSGTGPEAARLFCERVRSSIEVHPWALRPITVSFGIASLSDRDREPADLIAEADRALYLSKERGRNHVSHFEELALAGHARS